MADHQVLASAVVDLAAADDSAGVAAALRGLRETERRAVWKALRSRGLSTTAATVAALGCAPGAKSAADAAWAAFLDVEVAPSAVQVLADRLPAWLDDLATRLVAQEVGAAWGFVVVRGLVRDGIIAAPTDPAYVLAMVWGVAPANAHFPAPLDGLRADPALLEGELWELLGAERAGRQLAWADGWRSEGVQLPGQDAPVPHPEATWRHALVTLAGDGEVPRDRLLDAALHAMLSDWAAADVGWFVDLHDALDPSAAERASRAQIYLRLLASGVGRVVQLGLRALGTMLGSGAVEPSTVIRALEPALLRPQKGTAVEALRLLTCLGDGDPANHALAVEVARSGLDHPRADVREQARDLVRRWGQASEADAPEAQAPLPEAAPVTFAPVPVEPLTDADEVAELLAHLIEEADDPVGVERALDGVLRFAKQRPASGDALAMRAKECLKELYPGSWSGQELRADLAAVTLVWLGVERPGHGYRGRTVGHGYTRHSSREFSTYEVRRPDWSLPALVSLRLHEVATGIGNGAVGLLSLPTGSDGSLAATTLNERLRGRLTVPPIDLGVALLRVPPSERGEVRLPRSMHGRDAAAGALEMLMNHTAVWSRVVGPTEGLYASSPVTMVGWADLAGVEGAPDRPVEAVLDRRAPLERAGLEANDGEYAMRPEQMTAMWPLMLPHHLDHLASHAHPRLARALAKNRSGAVPVLEAIGRSPQRGGAPTTSALVLGLAAKDPGVRTAAIDAFILRADRDLVDVAGMAEQIRSSLSDDLVVGARIVGSITDVARAGRRSATIVLAVLAATAESLPGRRDAYQWVELLADLTNELDRPVALPQPFRDLASGSDRSVLATACRRVRVNG